MAYTLYHTVLETLTGRKSLYKESKLQLEGGGDQKPAPQNYNEFDEFYVANHIQEFKALLEIIHSGDGKDEDLANQLQRKKEIGETWAHELVLFYHTHKQLINDRLEAGIESDIKEARTTYGGWLSPAGKEIPVITNQQHEPVAQKILGDEWEEIQASGTNMDDASGILGRRGWARLVHQSHQTMVDMDTNAKLSHRQLSYLKDLGIENNVDIFLDVGKLGKYIYQKGE